MPVFKKRNSNQYLLTNYKVMYSTLRYSKSLQRVSIKKDIKRKVLLNRLYLNQTQFYFIVRNPYKKIESFFREKFRKSLDYYDINGYWQDSQKIFFPYLNIDDSMSSELIKEKLQKTTFNEMVALLPEVCMLDGHLQPQYLKTRIYFRRLRLNFTIPIKFKKVFKLESKSDLRELRDIFNINIESKVNETSSVKGELIWTKETIGIVDEIYKVDFDLFDYKKGNSKN